MKDEKKEGYPLSLLLDSSLISATILSLYDLKVVDCCGFLQVYIYECKQAKKNKKDDSDLTLKKINSENSFNEMLEKNLKQDEKKSLSVIEEKNIMRSKLSCQRLAKANVDDWHSFITLTFENNIVDVSYANKRFKYYVDKIKRVKKDFKYLCVPEFQKRGAVHYHLLTNLECNSKLVPNCSPKRLYNPSSRTWKVLEYYNLPYWREGFSSAEEVTGNVQKIVGYISKYLTKDIDDRLYNRHRYFYSQNLNRPKESYINLDNEKDREFYKKIIQDTQVAYQNEYINPYDNSKVSFLELQKQIQ